MSIKQINNARTLFMMLSIKHPEMGLVFNEFVNHDGPSSVIVTTKSSREDGDLSASELASLKGIANLANAELSVQLNAERDGLEVLII